VNSFIAEPVDLGRNDVWDEEGVVYGLWKRYRGPCRGPVRFLRGWLLPTAVGAVSEHHTTKVKDAAYSFGQLRESDEIELRGSVAGLLSFSLHHALVDVSATWG
jgi:hypothetical protein